MTRVFEFMVVVCVVLLLVAVGVMLYGALTDNSPCFLSSYGSFECRKYRVGQCLKTELYTRDECVQMIGAVK